MCTVSLISIIHSFILTNTFYDLFRHLYMSPDFHMKHWFWVLKQMLRFRLVNDLVCNTWYDLSTWWKMLFAPEMTISNWFCKCHCVNYWVQLFHFFSRIQLSQFLENQKSMWFDLELKCFSKYCFSDMSSKELGFFNLRSQLNSTVVTYWHI